MQNKSDISQYEKMTETPVSKLVMTLSVPTVISMLITNIYNLADTAFVGKLGTSASGATGIVFGLMSIIQAVGFLFGQGSGSIISRLLGGKDTENSSKTASAAFCGTVFFGMIISVFGFIFITPLVRFLGSTETIEPYAKTYVSYILFAAPFMTACFTLNNILRYEGKAAYGMAGLITGALLNICGDAFFMFVLNMGIAGAGLSTALSQIISFIIILSMFLRNKTVCKIHLKYFIPTLPLFMNIITTGLPSLLRQGLNSIATVILNSCAAPFGDEAIAAMSIVNKIIFFVFSIALGIGQGFQPVSGFNYGAKKYSRVKKAFYFTLMLSEIVVAVSAVFLMMFPEQLIMIFRDDKTVCDIGKRALILQSLSLFFLPLCTVTEMLFQSTGKKLGASVLSTLRSGVFFIPAIIILSEYRGLYGVEEAQPLAFVLAFIPSFILMIHFFKKIPKNDE
ncbi:MAG: MATE family efflux transporter [Oscillospiraceae bacterium]